jgi:hypothetical protein
MRPVKLVVLAVAGVVVAIAVGTVISAEMNQKEMVVTGEVVDLYCYLEAGARGPGHKECAITCAKVGQPIGIVDEKGHVYLALSAKDKTQSPKDLLADKMAETVTVTGKMVKKGGIEAVFIESVKEMPQAMPKEMPREQGKE